jgi:hypothetical protein
MTDAPEIVTGRFTGFPEGTRPGDIVAISVLAQLHERAGHKKYSKLNRLWSWRWLEDAIVYVENIVRVRRVQP